MKKYFVLIAFATLAIACSSQKNTSAKIDDAILVSKPIEEHNYTINVEYANPMRGAQINLSGGYTLSVRRDSAFAWLPYYGVARTAPMNSSEGGIKFEAPMKNYTQTLNKKQTGWLISFDIKDAFNVKYIKIEVFKNGAASISVTDNDRDPISFSGYVRKTK